MPKAKKGTKKATTSHFPSKPYMRALRAQSPTSVPTAAWSTTDDELLLRTKSSGKKWVEISPLFPGKTSNACRKRHARLVTHAQVEWDEYKERDLAVEFVNAKVGFFKMIAGNLKLEWRQVEKKCLELGFKTLLEKGKRIPYPFASLNSQQGSGGEGTMRPGPSSQRKSGLLPPPPSPSTSEVKAAPHPEPLESCDEDTYIPQSQSLRRRERVRIIKEDQDENLEKEEEDDEELSRDGGDELGDDDDALSEISSKDAHTIKGLEVGG